MKPFHVGYTQGVYDMFHIGHLNLLAHAKEMCDILLVGVNSDALVQSYKNKTPIIDEESRRRIVEAICYVDEAFIVDTLDKVDTHGKHPFDAIFIGSDWQGNDRWQQTERELEPLGAKVVYLPHTDGVSSSILLKTLGK